MKRKTNINTIKQIVSSVIQQYVDNLDNEYNILDEVPIPLCKGQKWVYYCVIYQTLSINGKHQYHVERNVIARTPAEASNMILTRWELESFGSKELKIKIICVLEDDGYNDE